VGRREVSRGGARVTLLTRLLLGYACVSYHLRNHRLGRMRCLLGVHDAGLVAFSFDCCLLFLFSPRGRSYYLFIARIVIKAHARARC